MLSAGIPVERAPLGIRVMQHGKDYMADKPGITTLEQLAEVRKVQAETKRIYSIMYSERFENRATVKAGELVKAGAIGRVIQTIGLGPHRITPASRPEWFWRQGAVRRHPVRHRLAPGRSVPVFHRIDQRRGRRVAGRQRQSPRQARSSRTSATSCCAAIGGIGYIRVDWFTPDGLATWGDGRLTILGTDGFIEIRKNVDIGGRAGREPSVPGRSEGDALHRLPRTSSCRTARQLVNDVVNRTETAMTQAHCFLATELMLKAQAKAQRVTFTS